MLLSSMTSFTFTWVTSALALRAKDSVLLVSSRYFAAGDTAQMMAVRVLPARDG